MFLEGKSDEDPRELFHFSESISLKLGEEGWGVVPPIPTTISRKVRLGMHACFSWNSAIKIKKISKIGRTRGKYTKLKNEFKY